MTIDQLILRGEYPPEPPEAERKPMGHSYYWDERAHGRTHDQAVRTAARMMGQAITSLRSVGAL